MTAEGKEKSRSAQQQERLRSKKRQARAGEKGGDENRGGTKTGFRCGVDTRLRADARATAKRRELLVSNMELRRREERRSSQSLRQLAKQGCEREGLGEPYEHPAGGVRNNGGDFQ